MNTDANKANSRQIHAFENDLLAAKPIDTGSGIFHKKIIPEKIGVYIWSTKKNQIVYVGSATSEKLSHIGLYRRIITELLNPYYLFIIKKKNLKSDSYQIRHCAYSKIAKKPAIDRNTFRKNIGRIENVSPGEPTVNFIKSNFLLRFIVVPSKDIAKKLKDKLIVEKQPKYNIQGK